MNNSFLEDKINKNLQHILPSPRRTCVCDRCNCSILPVNGGAFSFLNRSNLQRLLVQWCFFCWNWTVFGILVLFVPMSQCTSSVFLCCVFLTLPSQWSLCHCIRYPVHSTWPLQSFKTFNIHKFLSALSSECDIPVAGIFRCYRKNLAQKKDRNRYFLIWYRKKYQNQYR